MYAGGVEMDMYIAMSVRWGCRDGYVHSYGCVLKSVKMCSGSVLYCLDAEQVQYL